MNISVYFKDGENISSGTAEIVQELPQPGDNFRGHAVSFLEPCFFNCEQPVPDVYQYAVWAVHFKDNPIGQFIAVHEQEAETF